ncbi:MAG: S49 family peptidase [Undibacterium sp.]|nr:S49 family peptidase [Opitutaceae bacterium]
MSPAPLAVHLARLSRQPMLIRGDLFSAFGALALAPLPLARAPRLPAPRADDGGDDDCDQPSASPDTDPMPWDARERITLYPGGVAVIPVTGLLARGFDKITAWCYDIGRLEAIEAAIALVTARADVATVIFDFNTPGGYTTGIEEMATLIDRLGQSKVTVAFTSTMCCSAGYWLASQCATIIATRSSTVGSIGTYAAYYDYSGYLAQAGVELKLFRAGEMKGLGVFGHALTPEESAFVQSGIDELNARFLAAVRGTRGAVADATLQGQWFSGAAAVALGLVDANALTFAEVLAALTPPQPTTLSP